MHILLVHGALGGADQLEPLRQTLSRDHDIGVVELEGHGATRPSGERYAMRTFAENIRAALKERTVVFGYSMGGYAALLLAAEEPRAAGVITLGTKLAWSPEVAARETGRLAPATIRAKVPRFADQLEARHRGAGGWETVLGKTAALMTELGNRPLVDDALLTSIQQPVRLMVGDRDALVTSEETVAASRKLPAGQVAILPGTPHPIEQVRVSLLAALIQDACLSIGIDDRPRASL